jgi:retinol dehydrogenase 12
MTPPLDAKTTQGYKLQWGTNVVGHFVFTKSLLPSLQAAAKIGAPNSTRVVFTSSSGHMFSPANIINFEDVNLAKEGTWVRYDQSKAVQLYSL